MFNLPFLGPKKLVNHPTTTPLSPIIQTLEKSKQKLESENTILLAERNKLRILLSLLPEGLIVLDQNRNIITINNQALVLLHLSELEVLGSPIDKFAKFYDRIEEVKPGEYCPKPDTFSSANEYKRYLRLETTRDVIGYVDIVSTYINPTTDSQIRWMINLTDVSQEKQIEDMKIDFVSMAAHELRNPLTSIKGYLSVFITENGKKFDAEQNTFLNRIEIGVQKLTNLVENLLSVARIEKGVFTINTELVDIIPIIKQSISDQSNNAAEKNIKIDFQSPPQPLVSADKFRIGEVLQNLLSNAIEYTPQNGSIKISIQTEPDFMAVSIQDSGQGIPKEAIPHLFTKFFRASGKLSLGSKGTGLGLYISKAIIDMHRGKIKVESQLGQGSTFTFYLPLSKIKSRTDKSTSGSIGIHLESHPDHLLPAHIKSISNTNYVQ